MKLNEHAYNCIKELIYNEQLLPGIRYSETKLAKALGISRTPIRDALMQLSNEGFIDIRESRGFYLSSLSKSDLKDMFQLRMAIEGCALVFISNSLDSPEAAATVRTLRDNLSIQHELALSDSATDSLAATDLEFHSIIVDSLHNSTLSNLYHNQVYRIRRFAKRSFEYDGRIMETVREHEAIVDALSGANPLAAYLAASKHLDNLVNIISGMIDDETEPVIDLSTLPSL